MMLDSIPSRKRHSILDPPGPIREGFATRTKKRDLYVLDPGKLPKSISKRRAISPIVARITAQIADSRPTTNHQIPIVIPLIKPH
jgi:hypothetical protein